MGVVFACALSFMSKYLHASCGPKLMTRVDINDNNQSSNTKFYPTALKKGFHSWTFIIIIIIILHVVHITEERYSLRPRNPYPPKFMREHGEAEYFWNIGGSTTIASYRPI
jgi:hypothetical protein